MLVGEGDRLDIPIIKSTLKTVIAQDSDTITQSNQARHTHWCCIQVHCLEERVYVCIYTSRLQWMRGNK